MTLEFYSANTPNSQRVAVVMEELELSYKQHKIDIFAGEAKAAKFRAINPDGLLPVLIDPEGPDSRPLKLTQSWLICAYLAEKTGRYIPSDSIGRLRVQEALFQVASDVMMVHTTHNTLSRFVPEKVPSIIGYFEQRVIAALQNVDRKLGEGEYLAGELSVADFAFYPVYNRRRDIVDRQADFDNLKRWGKAMDARPACKRGVEATK